MDITFLQNCKLFRVFPKFLSFRLPYGTDTDTYLIRKRLLRSALHKRVIEKQQLDRQYKSTADNLRNILSSVDWFVLSRSIRSNVNKTKEKTIQTHTKKMHHLTQNTKLPFDAKDVIRNISSYKLSTAEEDTLKFGLKFGLQPKKVSQTDVLVTFESVYSFMSSNLKDSADSNLMKSDLTRMAQHYVSSYMPTKSALKKHAILKKLKARSELVITKPDKGNGVVIMNRSDYQCRR